ncbi:MAG: DinB family protein [Dehalococcoidales bacterium]|nr:DinB family protein [Dehalococcoidales bacterium]
MPANPPLTPQERREKIAQIAALPGRLVEAVAGLTPAQLTTHYLPGEWTVAQNVHHLADAHINAFARIKLMLTAERPTFFAWDQPSWANLPDANGAELGDSLALLRALHGRWVILLESLDEAQWRRVGLHPERGEMTVDDQLRTYSGHGEAHLQQIAKTLAAAKS